MNRFFDAHCDAVMNSYDGPFDFVHGDPRGHMDLPRLLARRSPRAGLRRLRRRLVLSRQGSDGHGPRRNRDAPGLGRRVRGTHGHRRGRDDIARAFRDPSAPVAAILGLEGADPLPDAAALEDFFDLGLRLIIPAWDDNHLLRELRRAGAGRSPRRAGRLSNWRARCASWSTCRISRMRHSRKSAR